MKKLLVLAAVVGLCWLFYTKVVRASPETRVCRQLESLCGEDLDDKFDDCDDEFGKARKLLGDTAVEKMSECVEDASSCVEAVGCVIGASSHTIDDFKRGFERGAE